MRQLIYKIIYHPFINPFLLRINKLFSSFTSFRLPPSGIIKTKLQSGSFKFYTNQNNTTSQYIFWHGPYYIEYTTIFEDLIKKCHCFFDVGSHAGYYSLIAATVNSEIKVVAFEPAKGPFYYLQKNIQLNHFENRVRAEQMALGDKDGEAEFLEGIHSKYFYLKHNLIAVGNLSNYQPNRAMKKTNVKIRTLDHFSFESGMLPDIIKMDTEGTENLILIGSDHVLRSKPIVICETLFNKIEVTLEKIMSPYGFEFYNFKDGKLHKVNTLIRDFDNGVHDCFFVHPEKKHLIAPYLA
jgi:FkbM family methyltransferase